MPSFGFRSLTILNPDGLAISSVKHAGALPVARSDAECRPPPVQSVIFLAVSYTHLRVRSLPHSFAEVAKSIHADQACSPRSAFALPFGRYFSNASRYCWVGLPALALSNGANALRTYTFFTAEPPVSISFWS